jgi:drug/metabolite transporter (DMT)-like permease
MQYIAPLIFSALALVDPAVTAILSWMIGVEDLPSLFSWLGGAVVMMGVGLISYGEYARDLAKPA